MFKISKTITSIDLELLCSEVAPNAFAHTRRLTYGLLNNQQVEEFLFKTAIDRNPYREHLTSLDPPEFVCVDFADIGAAILRQERVKDGCDFPFAVGVASLLGSHGQAGHCTVFYVNEDSEMKFIEFDQDKIIPVQQFLQENNLEINLIHF